MATLRSFAVFGVQIANINVATGYLVATGGSITLDSKKVEAMNNRGQTTFQAYHDFTRTCTIECYPSGTTLATSNAANDMNAATNQNWMPGETLTLAGSEDLDINRAWIIQKSAKNLRTDGHVTWTIDLEAKVETGVALAASKSTV